MDDECVQAQQNRAEIFFPSRSWTWTQVSGVKTKFAFTEDISRRNSSARLSNYEGELCRRCNSKTSLKYHNVTEEIS